MLSIAVDTSHVATISMLLHTPIKMLHASQATSLDITQTRSPVPEHGMFLDFHCHGACLNFFESSGLYRVTDGSALRVEGQSLWKSYRALGVRPLPAFRNGKAHHFYNLQRAARSEISYP